MPWLLNVTYLMLLACVWPFLLYKSLRTGKYRQGTWRKLVGDVGVHPGRRPRAWFHAVSVGEVLLLKKVIETFRAQYPEWEVTVSTTTNTGHEVAAKAYPDLAVCYWPLDFTWAVRRAFDGIRPRLLVLAELELWPNAILEAHRRGIPIAVINGRMSPRSYRGYRRARWLMGRLLGKISLFGVQSTEYASRLIELGAAPSRVHVTGSVKYDGAVTDRWNGKTLALAEVLGWPLPAMGQGVTWVVGSTQAPEEEMALAIYQRLRTCVSELRLLLVPRHKERFDEVAKLVAAAGVSFVRRSALPGSAASVVLLDTLGELGAAWGLADVAFVGGSLSARGGQNMIEPAAYGAAVTFGPNVWNFQDTVNRLLERHAAIQIQDATNLERVTRELLTHAIARRHLGIAAQQFVVSQQGAVDKTVELLGQLMAWKAALAA